VASIPLSVGLFPIEPPGRMVALGQLAEQLGYTCAWVGDSQMIWREAYVVLGAMAQATTRINLATGVTNPITRDIAVTAAAMETLNELSGGRARLGIGLGDSSVETLGGRPARLADFEKAIQDMRELIAGETVEGTIPLHLTYTQPGTRVPTYLAVSGPKIHRLAGKIGDGAIVLVGVDPLFLEASRRELEAGAAQAGRNLKADGFRTVCWTPCSIADDGHQARVAVKAHVARVLKRDLPFALNDADMAIVRKIREEYEYYEHMVVGTPHGDIVPDELVEKFAIAGTPAEARDQLQRLAASGLVDEIAIIPHAHDPVDRERIMRQVADAL